MQRALLALLAPLLALGLLEGGLRLAGVGYPAGFLLPAARRDQPTWIPNLRFTWRFFGPERARRVEHFELARPKPADTIRLFVFGESAAQGDPDPGFGLGRMLQAILDLRFPDAHFEVVNTAITGINSHTILSIAKDCAAAEGDIWVLYIGNNEVVGPFGAGTIFGPQAPPLPVIRTSLALKASRLGQQLDLLRRRFRPLPPDKRVWGGMLMFTDNQVPAEDPRMAAVYQHFERNLADLLDLARDRGVRVVASTVAVNLRNGAPFASAHGAGLTDAARSRWEALVRQGEQALDTGAPAEALARWEQAAALDDAPAVLHYLQGHAQLAVGRTDEARAALARARDRDTLRFRCDSRLNEITRRLAGQRPKREVALVDAERGFAAHSPGGAPGFELFYDHVHPTFPGNYLLATLLGDAILPMLPEPVRRAGAPAWPSMEACAERLAWTPQREHGALSKMLGRYREPPFTFQRDHASQLRWLQDRIVALGRRAQDPRELAEACRQALARHPADAVILRRYAETLWKMRELTEAEETARRLVEETPNDRAAWLVLGSIQADQGQIDAALASLDRAKGLGPGDEMVDYVRGLTLAKSGNASEAEAAFRRAIEINPRQGLIYLDLARLQELAGQTAAADESIRLALTNRVLTVDFLSRLGGACMDRKWFAEALSSLEMALELDPAGAALRIQAGRCAAELGETERARQYYLQAVELAPDRGEGHFMLGLSYGLAGDTEGAVRHFEEAVRLMPDVAAAHINLARARTQAGQLEAARQSLQDALRIQPNHPEALRQMTELERILPP